MWDTTDIDRSLHRMTRELEGRVATGPPAVTSLLLCAQMRDRLLQLRVGPQALGFFEVTERVGEAAGDPGERHAEVALHYGIVGVDPQGGFKFGGGFGQTSGLSQSGAQIDVGSAASGSQAYGDLQLRDGVGHAAHLAQRGAQVCSAQARTRDRCAPQFQDTGEPQTGAPARPSGSCPGCDWPLGLSLVTASACRNSVSLLRQYPTWTQLSTAEARQAAAARGIASFLARSFSRISVAPHISMTKRPTMGMYI